jgi:hypothetical protein
MSESRPLVSVLVRTTGRPLLMRALSAAGAQTHRPLEIVVVNASGKPLGQLNAPSDVPVNIVEGGPYDRPRAANAALDHAKGEWLVFLDDDDAFAPTHVESLLATVQRSDARVAYSATAVVEPDGKARMVIGADFNRLHLFIGNYITIGAPLFSRGLLAQGVRFDERLRCFEDWDFIIQLAQRTHFVYTRLPTYFWFAYAGESGAGMGTNKHEAATRPYRDIVVAKWASRAAALNDYARRHPGEAAQVVRGPLPMIRQD